MTHSAENDALVEALTKVLDEHHSSRPAFIREADGNDWHQGVSVCSCGATFTGTHNAHIATALASVIPPGERNDQ